MSAKIYTTSLPDLLRIEPEQSADLATPIINFADLEAVIGKPFVVKQVNHSRSVKNVLRGLHAEHWGKIVWVPRGTVFSAIVDIRPDSPTFGKYEIFELSAENRRSLYIPEGFANSIYAQTDVDYMYMVTKTYDGTDTTAVAWDDPDIGVPWPNTQPIISQRDMNNPRLRELFPTKF